MHCCCCRTCPTCGGTGRIRPYVPYVPYVPVIPWRPPYPIRFHLQAPPMGNVSAQRSLGARADRRLATT